VTAELLEFRNLKGMHCADALMLPPQHLNGPAPTTGLRASTISVLGISVGMELFLLSALDISGADAAITALTPVKTAANDIQNTFFITLFSFI
jgi:hypothetical protein